jgi:prepilin-type N-terminal cleavage/methylation domain-containing protein
MTKTERRTGFSLIEMVFVLGVSGVLTGVAISKMTAARPDVKADAGMRVVLSEIYHARELAVAQRHNMRLTFTNGNEVVIMREELPGGALTVVSTVTIEGGSRFVLVNGVPDTPDAFGNTSAVAFGVASEVKFSADGQLINQNGSTINGSVFVALPNEALSARAVTVLGSTGRVLSYKWDGRNWTQA